LEIWTKESLQGLNSGFGDRLASAFAQFWRFNCIEVTAIHAYSLRAEHIVVETHIDFIS